MSFSDPLFCLVAGSTPCLISGDNRVDEEGKGEDWTGPGNENSLLL